MDDNFFNIEGKQLDKEQLESIKFIGNQLVIAGAGAGKTLSIVGKIKYLVEELKVNPKEILLLAFTDKVVNELKERVSKVTNKNIDILTFHKLGLKVFNRSDNHKEIYINAFYGFLRQFFYEGEYEKDIQFASGIVHFMNEEYNSYDVVELSEIKGLTANISKISLNGEKVNSVVALIVCNMLFQNDIDYEYIVKNKYSHYIILKDNNIIHFTKDAIPGDLTLKGVDYKNAPYHLYNYLNVLGYKVKSFRSYKDYLDSPAIAKRFEEFFESLEEAQKIASAADVYDEDFDYLIEHYCGNKPDNIMFIQLFREIRQKYCVWLKEVYSTDFDFMIYGPIEILRKNKFLPYKYIIVDEYQDISPARYTLLVEILKQKNGFLMAYGDDWQSIYSFSGSNNQFFMEFSKKIVDAKEFYLKNTYRNSQQLIEASSKFVMINPCQKSKNISSFKQLEKPIVVLKYSVSNVDSLIFALEKIKELEGNKKVELMVLGRTNYAIDSIKNLDEVIFAKCDENNREFYQFEEYSNIYIQFLTIHRAKGLEADYVFVTGVNEKDMPLEVNKKKPYAQILNKLNEYEEEKEHEKYEGLPSSEERRLFYVALTRSKNIVFLSVPNLDFLKPSNFIMDLLSSSKDKLEFVNVPNLFEIQPEMTCPECGGMIVEVSKKGRKYKFCENKCRVKI